MRVSIAGSEGETAMGESANSAEFMTWLVLALAAIFAAIGWVFSSSPFVLIPMALAGLLIGLALGWAFSRAARK